MGGALDASWGDSTEEAGGEVALRPSGAEEGLQALNTMGSVTRPPPSAALNADNQPNADDRPGTEGGGPLRGGTSPDA
jgi:hypothetical protein